MPLFPIDGMKDYQLALKEFDNLRYADYPSELYDDFEIVSELINHYENQTYNIEFPHPIQALWYYIEEHGYKLEQLKAIIGNDAQSILERDQPLSLNHIRALCKAWNIPAECLIQPYALKNFNNRK